VTKRKSCHKGSKTQRFTKFMIEAGLTDSGEKKAPNQRMEAFLYDSD
jgi:hypothetical protein